MNTQSFQIDIPLAPSVNEWVQSVSLPGITLGEASLENPFIRQPEPGDKLIFSPLSFSFIVDEQMKNFIEMFNWMNALGFPENLQQYGVMPHQVNRVSDKQVSCDITVLVYNNQTKPILKFTMFGCFPIALGDMPLNVAGTDSETPICTGDIMYRNYVIESII
jgi:hypothetical protein|tara:strand:+ start:195 stop:683 length:489 start_codon:yes stop_codon:yes gene_type:complete